MKKKMIQAVSKVLIMVLLISCLAGCGSKETGGDDQGAGSEAGNEKANGIETAGTGTDGAGETPYVIKAMMFGDGTTEDVNAVAAAVSELLMEKIGCKLDLTVTGFASYVQTVNLALSSGEKLDTFPNFGMSNPTLVDNGSIMALDEVYESSGGEMKNIISESDLACQRVEGSLYAIPIQTDGAFSQGFCFRKDIADELEIDPAQIKTLNDLEAALGKVHEAYPEMYPLVPDFAQLPMLLPVDDLKDSLGVLENIFNKDDFNVVNLYATDSYRQYVEKMYSWAQKGLIMPDASTNSESFLSLIKSGKAFCGFRRIGEPKAFLLEQNRNTGREMVMGDLIEPCSTSTSIPVAWVVNENCERPDKVMEFLNLCYTDKEIANLLYNGIEGRHYEYTDDTKQFIRYPDGKDAASVGYTQKRWGWPNQWLAAPFEGNSLTAGQDRLDFIKSATPSPVKGFVWDNKEVINEFTACTNVVAKYNNALLCGSIDPAEALPKFNKELEAAGINTIIEKKQAQLNKWLDEK